MHIIAQVSLLHASEESWNINYKQKGSCIYMSIYFGCTRADFTNLSHSRLLAMTDARSCLERLVSLSRLVNKHCWLLLGAPFECLPCFGSQRSSWETVSFLLLQQWPLNCSQHIWRLAEIGGRIPMQKLHENMNTFCSPYICFNMLMSLFPVRNGHVKTRHHHKHIK